MKGHVGHSGGAETAPGYWPASGEWPTDSSSPPLAPSDLDPAVQFEVPLGGVPVERSVDTMVVNGFGFGGQDSCLVATRRLTGAGDVPTPVGQGGAVAGGDALARGETSVRERPGQE